jgi:hypothetical protein
LIQGFASGQALLELFRFGFQRFVAEAFKLGFQAIDLVNHFAVLLEQAIIAAAKDAGEEIRGHEYL